MQNAAISVDSYDVFLMKNNPSFCSKNDNHFTTHSLYQGKNETTIPQPTTANSGTNLINDNSFATRDLYVNGNSTSIPQSITENSYPNLRNDNHSATDSVHQDENPTTTE
ncbi:unnamed protein product [Rotaria sp. Silwood2]|nr:unnamed protein product [Rotaria sp. Silwood2]CAF3472361.1 unnamed protein product [Rotaria sp. Silwood2]CAF4410420.1 unnamed protein product [Rotaria sp. Silwood2]CAF4640311.1 unnamed protein product [Rotaria sp. Silwood2]